MAGVTVWVGAGVVVGGIGAALVGMGVAVLGIAVAVGGTAVAVAQGATVAGAGVASLWGLCVEVGAGSGVAKATTPDWLAGGTGVETVGRGADPWPPPQAEKIRTVKIAIIGRTTGRCIMNQF